MLRRTFWNLFSSAKPDGKFCGTCGEATYSKTYATKYSQTTGKPKDFKTNRFCVNAEGNLPLTKSGEHEPWYGSG